MLILGHGQTDKDRPDTGMTLIELLVVVAILAVLAVGVTLTVGRADAGKTSRDADLFLDLWQRQADFARQTRTPHGVDVDARSVRPMRLGAAGWEANGALIRLDSRATVATERRPSTAGGPDLVLLPDGQSAAFQITFSDPASSEPTECHSDGWKRVTCN